MITQQIVRQDKIGRLIVRRDSIEVGKKSAPNKVFLTPNKI